MVHTLTPASARPTPISQPLPHRWAELKGGPYGCLPELDPASHSQAAWRERIGLKLRQKKSHIKNAQKRYVLGWDRGKVVW